MKWGEGMESDRVIRMTQDLKRKTEALEFLRSALVADSLVLYPCKALSKEVINQAFNIAGIEPVVDREVSLI